MTKWVKFFSRKFRNLKFLKCVNELRVTTSTIKWIFHYAVVLLLLFSLSLFWWLPAIIKLVWVLRYNIAYYMVYYTIEERFRFGFGKQFFAVLSSFRRRFLWWSHRLHQISHGIRRYVAHNLNWNNVWVDVSVPPRWLMGYGCVQRICKIGF